ncbi:MAG: LytTR family transcriptional regulator [Rhodobacteraceae bacterium]|nr:LytTR family transcriptional regulator [Paracoccaceae bacterium]
MQSLLSSVWVRYGVAILGTAAFMVWQSTSASSPDDPAGGLALFWGLAVLAGWLQMVLIARGVRASFGGEAYPGWVMLIATALIGAVPLTFEVRWLMETIVQPDRGLLPVWLSYLNVAFINLNFCLIQYLLIERWPILKSQPVEISPTGQKAPPPGVGMLRRRPDGVNGVIRYLQIEDHYLRVTTDQGDGLVLCRMADAVADLAAAEGMQVHRSWWVARNAVAKAGKNGRSRFLRTVDGQDIPVGRSFEKSLRDAGWF